MRVMFLCSLVLYACGSAMAIHSLWSMRRMQRNFDAVIKLKDELIAIQRAELERLWHGKKMPDTFWLQKGNSN